jgi:hypothetical protein
MRALLCVGAIAFALTGAAMAQLAPSTEIPATGGVGATSKPDPVQLTPEQKRMLVEAVKRESRNVKPPAGAAAQVGAELPPSIELYLLPDSALAQIPEAKHYRYTLIDGQVVLVDPTTMRVVDVLAEAKQ